MGRGFRWWRGLLVGQEDRDVAPEGVEFGVGVVPLVALNAFQGVLEYVRDASGHGAESFPWLVDRSGVELPPLLTYKGEKVNAPESGRSPGAA